MRSFEIREMAERPLVAGSWSLAPGRDGNPLVIYIIHSVYLCRNGCQENFIGGGSWRTGLNCLPTRELSSAAPPHIESIAR